MKFHDFITTFEDNMADSAYSEFDKTHWKKMLYRRLSRELRVLLNAASDAPAEYHAFVNYLREKDAVNQSIKSSPGQFQSAGPYRPPSSAATPASKTLIPTAPASQMPSFYRPPNPAPLTVSQGGTAMDLDMVSREKGPDGKLTPQAKNARRTLGRCVWCNQMGHFAISCPLGSQTVATTKVNQTTVPEENLKAVLQQ
ncbi:hypothetical protein K3495_g15161 [Podosphaera aphanis]|nr:hypothetical protein K3495_g15161 [Podosphaera aphanis]